MKDNLVYVKHILDHIEYIEVFARGISESAFYNDLEKEFAVIRAFEVIGEAGKKVDKEFRERYDKIPWKEMAAFRDVLIHNYDRVVSNIIWKTIKEDLPILKKHLREILDQQK